jgi:hypothetical protein
MGYGLNILDGQRILRTEIISGAAYRPFWPIIFHKPYHNKPVSLGGEVSLIEYAPKPV